MLISSAMAFNKYRRVRYPRRRLKRRPIRRYSRRKKFRRIPRPLTSGNNIINCRSLVTLNPSRNGTLYYNFNFKPSDFEEFNEFVPQYEAYACLSCVVTIIPYFNYAQAGALDAVPLYCTFPWHQPTPPTAPTFQRVLSIDKAKTYLQTQRSTRKFVPAILEASQTDTGNVLASIRWRPRIQLYPTGSPDVIHYTGMLASQENPYNNPGGSEDTRRDVKMAVIRNVRILFMNQKLIK